MDQLKTGGIQTANALLEAIPYVNYFAGKTVVVKIGGGTITSQHTILRDIVLLKNLGVTPVLVHGGGNEISAWLQRLGKETKFVNGLRVTDEETMEIVKMVLVGKVNTSLVAGLTALNGKAVGLSGLDGALIQARQNTDQGDLGLVGDVVKINLTPLKAMIDEGFVPVIAPIGVGPKGVTLNINADTAAGYIAAALSAEKILFLTDVPGVMDKEGTLYSKLTMEEAERLIASGVISGGMIPKLDACFIALETVQRAHIIDGRIPHAIIRELYTDSGVGTMIVREAADQYKSEIAVESLLEGLESDE